MTIRKKLLATLAVGTLGLVSFRAASDNERYFEIAKNLDIFATLFKVPYFKTIQQNGSMLVNSAI